ncbi:CrcB family protein [Streptomyces sp. A73]|uniref:FluC/FEX family fluoride channel n=1 Tax=Streptomyces TaxID=1883 RepID=UPI001B383369|nr:CrcB family protein [Streptomyces sp. RK75]MBQ0865881.1 CrcB family protein [Streptomyces sp. RK75]MBQ1157283.1 CrcB family protein [Streptomyces sp. A73]
MPLMMLLGAVGGAALRFGLEKGLFKVWPGEPVPWAAFAVNCSGCIALGVFLGNVVAGDLPSQMLVLLGGAITTFSIFGHELLKLTQGGLYGTGLRVFTGWVIGAGAAVVGVFVGMHGA